ncbi:MAG TPA: E3 binding domain-containing protein, partial [Pseudolysinimonas sp.]|nr:E3 binding domain-containing protein [Pseudolysinimonas sp.]
MATVVRMPSVLANATEAAIQTWLAAEGQSIAVGDPLAEIETEKAVVEYASEVEGTVGKLIAQPGDNLVVGTPIAVILAAGEGADQIGPALEAAGVAVGDDASAAPVPPATAAAPATAAPEASTGAAAAPAPSTSPAEARVADPPPENSGTRRFASPIVRRLALERGIDLGRIAGTGPGGRIVRRDLDGVAAAAPAQAAAPAAPVTGGDGAGFTDIPLTGMR